MGTWSLTGNALGTPPSGFLGTTDHSALVIKTGSPTTERLRVDTSGNVGIGTSAPADKLHIQGASDPGACIAIQRSDNHKFIRLGVGTSGVALDFDSTSYLVIQNNDGMGIGGIFNGPALLCVTSNGNVGIGTVTPAASLDVTSGLLHVGGTTTPATAAQGAYLGWNALTGGTGETDFINNQGLGTGGFAFMNTPASGNPRTTLMVITGSGNVGIGTPSPTSSLQVNGSLAVTGAGLLTVNGEYNNPEGTTNFNYSRSWSATGLPVLFWR